MNESFEIKQQPTRKSRRLLFLIFAASCRTAMNDAMGYHDSNYSTFDRIQDFRK